MLTAQKSQAQLKPLEQLEQRTLTSTKSKQLALLFELEFTLALAFSEFIQQLVQFVQSFKVWNFLRAFLRSIACCTSAFFQIHIKRVSHMHANIAQISTTHSSLKVSCFSCFSSFSSFFLCSLTVCRRSRSKTPQPLVIIEGLTLTTTEQHLLEIFGTFGSVERVEIPLDSRGLRKSYSYVVFKSKSSAETAVVQMNGGLIDGSTIRASLSANGKRRTASRSRSRSRSRSSRRLPRRRSRSRSHSRPRYGARNQSRYQPGQYRGSRSYRPRSRSPHRRR